MRTIVYLIIILSLNNILFSVELPSQDIIKKWEEKAKFEINPDIFYNLGVYYSRISNTSKAILNFKRAHLLSPKEKQFKEALRLEREKLDLPVLFLEPSPLEKILLYPFNFASINAITILGITLLSIGAAGISFYLFSGKIPFKKYTIPFLIISFTLGIVYISAGLIRHKITFDKNEAVILEDCSIFDSSSLNPVEIEKVIGGMECRILEESNGYYLIVTLNGKKGWIKTNSIEKLWN